MSGHVFEEHENCDEVGCMICVGGLSYCVVCGGAEGSLMSDCAEMRVHADLLDAVYAGIIDFRDGRWVLAANGGVSSKSRTEPISVGGMMREGAE